MKANELAAARAAAAEEKKTALTALEARLKQQHEAEMEAGWRLFAVR